MANPLPSWYGKLPSLGDFASRRLEPLFIEPWDCWLAAGLASWREVDAAWLERYLGAPPLRFALGAGVPFEHSPGYTGVLMPSVDRVGRYFPLTVVRPRGLHQDQVPAAGLQALEEVAVSALQGDWSVERFETELGELAELDDTAATGPAWPADGQTLWWKLRDGQLSASIAAAGLPSVSTLLRLLAEPVQPDFDLNERAPT